MSKKRRIKKLQLFDPDQIVTMIERELTRDLAPLLQEYNGVHSATAFAVRSQLKDLRKKYLSEATHNRDAIESETFQAFRKVNDHMLDINIRLIYNLPDANTRIQSHTPFMDKIHLRARSLCRFILGSFDEEEWFTRCKHSGGSSIGVPFKDTSMEKKYSYPISATLSAERLFRRYLDFDFQLKSELEKFNSNRLVGEEYLRTEGSRATTVDKTTDKRRMICVEPTANMYLQQGLMHVLYDRLRRVGLDVETLPERHKELAREASITGRYATIDWSSASDCVSIELLRWLIPPDWFDGMWYTRSPYTNLEGSWTRLHMYATMGNATTFPLETLVFWTYAYATLYTLRNRSNSEIPDWELFRYCSVFGDDCIVPSDIASQYIEVMEEVGFSVNLDKTFTGTERFRESCGGDYLAGRDVRPYFLKAPVSNRLSSLEPWLYVITNSVLKKYVLYFGTRDYVYDKALLRYLFGLFNRYGLAVKLVPNDFPDDAGLKWSFDYLRLKRSYDFRSEAIYEDKHGTRLFTYLSFQYRKKNRRYDPFHYVTVLKQNSARVFFSTIEDDYEPNQLAHLRFGKEPHRLYPVRLRGGYVVAKGLSGHWSDRLTP